ncbi:MAG: GNAT family N-acetyltransferase [Phycisphaerales bacterium]|nr:GNAT family N-acetyltransferase [Phycisphaerales bacterium]
MAIDLVIDIQPATMPPTKNCASHCGPILRALPEWFGIEPTTKAYIESTDQMPTILAFDGQRAVGFLTLNRHFPQSAEIHVVGVHPDYHRQGVGRMLQAEAERWCREQGVRLLQVKTVSEGRECPHYKKTRAFYLSMGFVPLEVFPTLWDEACPCLQLVKPLL